MRASSSDMNQLVLRHSSRKLPLKDSIKASGLDRLVFDLLVPQNKCPPIFKRTGIRSAQFMKEALALRTQPPKFEVDLLKPYDLKMIRAQGYLDPTVLPHLPLQLINREIRILLQKRINYSENESDLDNFLAIDCLWG